jgi:hypothetical protein
MVSTKRNKMLSLSDDVFLFLQEQENASAYVDALVYAEIRKDIERKKKKENKELDISSIHELAIVEDATKAQKEVEKKARSAAWDLLDLEIKEEIKDMPDWGVKWNTIFYPMYEQTGSLTLKEVRDWYFANKEGFKL